MSTIISCSHKCDDVYNYNIEKDIEDDNGFEVNVLVRVNGWVDSQTMWQPENSGFGIDYDSFEVEFNNHSESEIKMINDWIESHKQKGTFEDAFGTSYFEIE
jgi:hypothetical protein